MGDGGAHPPETGGGGAGTGVSQEAVTTTVLNALSNLKVVRRLLAAVSPDGGSGSTSTLAADGKLSLFMHQVQ